MTVFACALAARLWGIGDKPFWLDELTTLRRASPPMAALVRDSLSYHHLPTHFALLAGAMPPGQSEAVLRAPSALFGAMACVLVAAAASRVGGRDAGLLVGLLMAFSPIQVQCGQEARSYTCGFRVTCYGARCRSSCSPGWAPTCFPRRRGCRPP